MINNFTASCELYDILTYLCTRLNTDFFSSVSKVNYAVSLQIFELNISNTKSLTLIYVHHFYLLTANILSSKVTSLASMVPYTISPNYKLDSLTNLRESM